MRAKLISIRILAIISLFIGNEVIMMKRKLSEGDRFPQKLVYFVLVGMLVFTGILPLSGCGECGSEEPALPNVLFATADGEIFVGTSVGEGIARLERSGESWVRTGVDADIESFAASGSILYAGGGDGSIFRSEDGFKSWTRQYVPTKGYISALVVFGSIVYAGTRAPSLPYPGGDDGVFRSDDGGNSWTAVGLAGTGIEALAVVGSTLYAAPKENVFRSEDEGETWEETGLSGVFVNDLVVVGLRLYAGTSEGVFRLRDDGKSWEIVALSGTSVTDLAASGSKLYAGSRVFYIYPRSAKDNGGSWIKGELSGISVIEIKGEISGSVTDLAVVGSKLYAGSSDWGVPDELQGVFLSEDDGKSWRKIEKGFPTWRSECLPLW